MHHGPGRRAVLAQQRAAALRHGCASPRALGCLSCVHAPGCPRNRQQGCAASTLPGWPSEQMGRGCCACSSPARGAAAEGLEAWQRLGCCSGTAPLAAGAPGLPPQRRRSPAGAPWPCCWGWGSAAALAGGLPQKGVPSQASGAGGFGHALRCMASCCRSQEVCRCHACRRFCGLAACGTCPAPAGRGPGCDQTAPPAWQGCCCGGQASVNGSHPSAARAAKGGGRGCASRLPCRSRCGCGCASWGGGFGLQRACADHPGCGRLQHAPCCRPVSTLLLRRKGMRRCPLRCCWLLQPPPGAGRAQREPPCPSLAAAAPQAGLQAAAAQPGLGLR